MVALDSGGLSSFAPVRRGSRCQQSQPLQARNELGGLLRILKQSDLILIIEQPALGVEGLKDPDNVPLGVPNWDGQEALSPEPSPLICSSIEPRVVVGVLQVQNLP